jgi:hypothetical protein
VARNCNFFLFQLILISTYLGLGFSLVAFGQEIIMASKNKIVETMSFLVTNKWQKLLETKKKQL